MEAKDLKEAVAKLNESGLLAKKFTLPKKEFIDAFKAAAEEANKKAVAEDKDLPDEVVKAYDLCKSEKKAQAAVVSEEQTSSEKGKSKIGKKGKVTASSKKQESKVKTSRGCRPGTLAAFIFNLASEGISLNDAAKKLEKKFQKKNPASCFKGYIKSFQERGFDIKVKDNYYKLA